MSRFLTWQPRVEIPLLLALPLAGLVWTARKIGRALVVAVHNPRYATATGLGALAILGNAALGVWAPWAVLGLAVATTAAWAIHSPVNVQQSLRGWRQSNRKYRWTWGRTLRRCDAAKSDVPLPLLLTTRSTRYVDKLRVKVPTGLDPTVFQDYRGDLLKWGWRAQSTRVFNPQSKRHTVELWNLIDDPLVEPVPPLPQPAEILPKAGLQMALIEDGEWWRLKIRGAQAAHVFVCGISGSGKGSYIAALLDRQLEAIHDGSVEAWGIDPQASELGMSRHLFKKLVFTRQDAAAMLENLLEIMDRRTRSMFGLARQHHPAPDDPFIELIIDEGLDLLDKTDRPLYRRIDKALRELLRKGRKASIRVSFISQRAELAIVEIRKDFQIWVAFQLARETDVDMVMGRGALASGANAHDIDQPGICYIRSDRGILRARFPHFTDTRIQALPPAPGNEDPANLPVPSLAKVGGVA
jgi:S-DNA-T family DNA segregation ATPase FtsK/SpoIIIE